MIVKKLLGAVCDASDRNESKVALFQPSISGAKLRRNGDTVITLTLVTNEFTPNDVMDGLWCMLAIATKDKIKQINEGTDESESAGPGDSTGG